MDNDDSTIGMVKNTVVSVITCIALCLTASGVWARGDDVAAPVADVNHGEDYERDNCLVRSFIDSFTEDITDILFVCSDSEGAFRLDFYPVYGAYAVTFFDAVLSVNGRLPEVALRFDEEPARRFADGQWSNHGGAQFILGGEGVMDILAGIVNTKVVRYRVSGVLYIDDRSHPVDGEIRNVHLPDTISEVVEEFVLRMKDTIVN